MPRSISLCLALYAVSAADAGPIPFTYRVVGVNEQKHPDDETPPVRLSHPLGSEQTFEWTGAGWLRVPISEFWHETATEILGRNLRHYRLDIEVEITDPESGQSGTVGLWYDYYSHFHYRGNWDGKDVFDWVHDRRDFDASWSYPFRLGRHEFLFGTGHPETLLIIRIDSEPIDTGIVETPEPATLGIAFLGLAGLGAASAWKRRPSRVNRPGRRLAFRRRP